MKMRKAGYQVMVVLLLSVNFGILFFDRNSLNFLMPFVQPELRLNYTEVGILSSALSLTWALSGMMVGAWSDRACQKKIFIIAAGIIFSLCSFISGIAYGFLTLLGARLLMGVAEGAVMPISHAIAVEEVTPERRGVAMGVVQNLGSCFLGSFLAPVLLPILAVKIGWRHAFYLAGAPGLLLAVLIWILIEEPEHNHQERDGSRLSLREALKHKNMVLCILISIAMVSYLVITLAFMPLYLTKVRHIPAETAGWLVGLLGLSATISGFVVPAISDRIGRRPVMVAIPLISLILPLGTVQAPAVPLILGPIFFFGWAMNSIFPLFMATIPSETLPVRYVATATGIVMGLGEIIGGACSPFLAGWASDIAGLNAIMWILGGLAVAASFFGFFLDETAPTKRKTPVALAAALTVDVN